MDVSFHFKVQLPKSPAAAAASLCCSGSADPHTRCCWLLTLLLSLGAGAAPGTSPGQVGTAPAGLAVLLVQLSTAGQGIVSMCSAVKAGSAFKGRQGGSKSTKPEQCSFNWSCTS